MNTILKTNDNTNYLSSSSLSTSDVTSLINSASILATNNTFTNLDNTFNNVNINGHLQYKTSSSNIIKLGYNALNNISSLTSQNVAIGYESQILTTTGTNNVSIGHISLKNNKTGSNNTAIGSLSLAVSDGNNYVTAIGVGAAYNSLNQSSSTNIGYQSGFNGSSYSTSIGFESLYTSKENYNTAIGYNSLNALSTGTLNTAIGASSASKILSTGSNNTFLGANTSSLNNINNSTAIGVNSAISKSNTIVLGTSNETVVIPGVIQNSLLVLSSSTTLSLPLSSIYIINNGAINIIITLPTLSSDGFTFSIRKLGTGSVTISYTSIFSNNSIISASAISNNTSSSYLSYGGSFYQLSSF